MLYLDVRRDILSACIDPELALSFTLFDTFKHELH